MAKKINAVVKLQIAAGKATPAPPVGPSLAQHGINIGDFCSKFNDETRDKEGFTMPVEVTVFQDRTFTFKVKQPPASELLKKAAGIEKGTKTPGKGKVGKITREQLKEVAEKKMPDLNADDIEAAMSIIQGTAKNMGIDIVE
ncbi:MAG: 50S ribosomal protein L11 [Candidatus Nealsonbacteria bacterium]|nr:50S ribosomal protein L11 [Candidatus Nealsonbacteria bacterium]